MESTLNRCVVFINHRPPYLAWGQSLDTGENIPVPVDGNAYLVEESVTGTDEEAEFYLKKYWRRIANEEFESWSRLPAQWPKLQNFKDFKKYFSFEVRELVIDLCDYPIGEDFDEEEDFSCDQERN